MSHVVERIDETFARALEAHGCGRDEEAKTAYLSVLQRDPTHLGALNNLGTLLFNAGFRSAARTAYRQAVHHHPRDLAARVNYGNALYAADDWYQAREQFEAALALDPACAEAHRGMTYVLERFGDERAAARHRDRGFRAHPTTYVPYRGEGRAIAVLLLQSARGGNVDTERFLDDRTFAVTKVFAEYLDPTLPLPFHAFAFNAIADAERCARDLAVAQTLLTHTNAPVLNAPRAVAATDRASNAERLGALPGVRAPRTRRYARAALADGGAAQLERDGFAFPLLVRTPGFHTGEHFVRVERAVDLERHVADLPGTDLAAIEHLDARGRDGFFRKYRVMFVDGAPYPLHLAIAPEWKVHYFTASMQEHAEHRDEERAFLDDMPSVLGDGMDALAAIARTLALDYAGIDFALGPRGEILLFEANAAMMIPAPPSDPIFAYRRAAIERALAAVRAMLLARTDAAGIDR